MKINDWLFGQHSQDYVLETFMGFLISHASKHCRLHWRILSFSYQVL